LQDLTKIYPNWDFWIENIPSGNTVLQQVVEEEEAGGGRALEIFCGRASVWPASGTATAAKPHRLGLALVCVAVGGRTTQVLRWYPVSNLKEKERFC
jgi:hypothetical protein